MLRFYWVVLLLALTGCDQIMEIANQGKANGKAIGAGCRHSGRSLEDCYQRNPKVPRSDIFTGWKEMNEYMLTKKMDVVPPPPDAPKESGHEKTKAEDTAEDKKPDSGSAEAASKEGTAEATKQDENKADTKSEHKASGH